MVDTTKTPALGHMEIVPNRACATLLPIIQAHTLPGTIIHSDDSPHTGMLLDSYLIYLGTG